MDIIVKAPKAQRQHILHDKCDPEREWAWWTLGSVPRKLHGGAHVHIQCDGDIIASARIHSIDVDTDGVRINWRPSEAEVHDPPLAGVPGGWRGWRYGEK